ncbi:hypothetical protein HNP99_000089 [Flavobacterium sp. 28A]|uniref:hypothetical protein n=1 Tax=Flavobacterium sp. 28A TaxID=2735895 RepID=UPI00156E2E7C|nr:hypothetical protein [Flavobacterium sp. 28A]NRT13764.1 hypothetical protein [Flavobacterium sp. 28A]
MSQNNNDPFLNKFIEIKEFPTSEFFMKNEIIIKNDTINLDDVASKFLIPLNKIKYSDLHIKNKYYYYGRYKLNEIYYIISCKIFFNYHESMILSFIYNTDERKITSSIEIMVNDFNLSKKSYFKDEVLVIENTYNKIPNGLDPPKGKEFLKRIEIDKFKIDNNFKFIQLKPSSTKSSLEK